MFVPIHENTRRCAPEDLNIQQQSKSEFQRQHALERPRDNLDNFKLNVR
jgi:hypothetical protein